MPPNHSTSARQARDQHALGGTIIAMGRRHEALCHRIAIVNGIGLHQDSPHRAPTDKDGNLLTVPEVYQLAGICRDFLSTRHLQARCPGQHSHRSLHPVDKSILDPGMFSLEYSPLALDSLQSTDGQADRASKPDDGAVSPGFLQLEQDNWVELLQLAEFAYNNPIHASTRMTSFWANYHCHPVMQFMSMKQPSRLKSEILADSFAGGLEETNQTLSKNLQEAPANQTKHASGKEVVFEVGARVWLSMRNFRTTRLLKKLDYKWTGPYSASMVINKNAYKLDLLYRILKHNGFLFSLLDAYISPTAGQSPSEVQPMVVEDTDEWEVDRILDCKQHYRKLH